MENVINNPLILGAITSLLGAVAGAVVGYFLGIRTRVISERIKRRSESVDNLLSILEEEFEILNSNGRHEAADHNEQFRKIILAYKTAQRNQKKKKKNAIQLQWERYTAQMDSNATEKHSAINSGYRGSGVATGAIINLINEVKDKWS